MNLIHADFYRLFRSKGLYAFLALVFLLPLPVCLMFPGMTTEKVLFQGLDATLFCSVAGIAIALFIGKDYENNTVRNKICYGVRRGKVVLANFLESGAICLLFAGASVLSSLIFGSLICDFSFGADFAAKLFCQLAVLLAFSAVATAITTCAKSLKVGLVGTLAVSVLLPSVGQMLPMLATTSPAAGFFCRILYSSVSANLINGTGGTYVYVSYAQGGASAVFGGMYANALVLAAAYAAASVCVALFAVRRQSYK